jgi:hypothetical protein
MKYKKMYFDMKSGFENSYFTFIHKLGKNQDIQVKKTDD